ncbi:MAG: helix-turn-helix domain-containing protein [Janthinobacterium lividum]
MTFTRAFVAETGKAPARAVERLRAELAQQRIEGGSDPIEVIARDFGFPDPERMRRAFLRRFGFSPPERQAPGAAPVRHPSA